MLSYEDCVRLSGLTDEEIAAIAQHEHLPEIVALEMGACLCGSTEGRQLIRRMIIDDSEKACRHGDTRTAARLGLLLHHFLEEHQDRPSVAPDPSEAGHLGAPPWVAERVDSYLSAMLGRFGMDRAALEERYGLEMRIAEMCCAACTQTGRCRRFLSGVQGAEAPSLFCPNAPLLEELGQSLHLREGQAADVGRTDPD